MIHSEAMRITLYSIMPVIGWIVALIFNLMQYKRKKEMLSYCIQSLQKHFSRKANKKTGGLFIILEIIVISFVLPFSALPLNSWFGNLLDTGANYFGTLFFLPIILFVYCCIIWVDPIKQFDLITPALPLALFFIRLGCFFFGCCNGFEWEYGLYSYKNERFEIPLQLIEGCIALGIFVFLLYWRKKAKPGTMFPTYLTLYSLLRFFIEFLSGSQRTILIFFNKYQVLCFIGVVLGLIQYMLMLKYGERISKYFDENPYGFIKALFTKNKAPKKQKSKTK